MQNLATSAQASRLAAMRHQWDSIIAYWMPADHRHSPGIVIAALDNAHDPDGGAVVRIHPDGRREAITDAYSAQHFLADARNEGARVYA